MSRVEDLWERLVRAALRRERTGTDAYGRPVTGIAGYVPSSLSNNRDIDAILRTADEIQDEDPNISRILCEHAYSLAQNLDPNSEGRGVLQFKTGLMSVIKQKLAKREGGAIDRSQDLARLQEFYKIYREKHNVDKLREEEMKLRESGAFSGNLGEFERKTVKRKKVFATLKVLGTVLKQLTQEVSPEVAERLIPDELKNVMESDAAMTDDLIAYNIIPLDAPSMTNAIVFLPEVKAAVSALNYFRGLPKLPENFPIPATRNADILDFLQYVFGFQDPATGRMISKGRHTSGGLYVLEAELLSLTCSQLSPSPLELYCCLGHPTLPSLKCLCPSLSTISQLFCESCEMAKHHCRTYVSNSNKRASAPYSLVH